jgi:hypothetical protein
VVALIGVAETFADDVGKVMVAGSLGLIGYALIHGLGELFEAPRQDHSTAGGGQLVGKAAASLFCYLEVLDASFSLDGVIGAFAISQNIFVIAAGLGVGAMYIRSLTVFLVRRQTLGRYVFLEHGAMWAIGALSVILLVSIGHEAPDVVTGLVGVAFIGGAFASSLVRNRRRAAGLR